MITAYPGGVREGERMRWPVAVLACVVVAAGTSATGCARCFACAEEGGRPSGLVASDLVGTYAGKPSGRLTLEADGTFTALDWPDPDDFEITSSTLRIPSGNGTRTLKPRRDFGDVQLLFTTLGTRHNYGGRYEVSGSRREPRMYRFAGDPDICKFHTFRRTRRESESPPVRVSESPAARAAVRASATSVTEA